MDETSFQERCSCVMEPFSLENMECSSDLIAIISNCEINSIDVGRIEIDKKITNDLRIIEDYLDAKMSSTTKDLTLLIAIIHTIPIPTEEGQKQQRIELSLSLKNIRKILEEINKSYEGCKEKNKKLSPILKLGGYRSFLIYLIESLIVIEKKVRAIDAKTFPSKKK